MGKCIDCHRENKVSDRLAWSCYMQMKRREFLKIGPTVGAASLILDGCGKPEKLIPLLVSPDEFVPDEEGWVHSICQTCSAGCGILVRVMQGESIRTVDGQEKRVKAVMAKKIEGNPAHPISMGGTCARGQASVQALYHPDRIQGPLKLSGPRGSGQYQSISWKDAMQLLDHATATAAGHASGRGDPHGTHAPRHDGHGARALCGRPWHDQRGVLRPVRSGAHSQGDGDGRPAARGCRWSTSPTRATCCRSTPTCSRRSSRRSATSIHTAMFRQGRPGIRGKFVQAEPRHVADRRVRRRVAAHQARHRRAAGAGHGARDRQGSSSTTRTSCAQSTAGFAEWSGALADYAPETVAPQVDVKAESIASASRASSPHAGPAWPWATAAMSHSLAAIYALNALVGAYGKAGGILLGADARRTRRHRQRTSSHPPHPSHLTHLICCHLIAAMSAGQVKALLVIDGNPLFTLPEQDKLRSALGNVPFIASFSSFLDETAAMADLILPNHVPLERWIDDVPEPGVGFPVRTVGRTGRAAALGNARHRRRAARNGEGARRQGRRSAAVREHGRGHQGVVPLGARAERREHRVDADFDAFYKKVTAAGGWWNDEGAQGSGLRAQGEDSSS